ncbi:MAG: tRNA 4-thiouridine(8) synthase ThiI [Archaeoglobaceae archaeon]|nr:tRNA 4-thiouridine(8) synthase ThiI [Archaeoglobaceae archaeon]MCX8152346.1 tRNA 4-thiouridine(8) synthase ThiI [Archaeoglobaceae archaeon]MDW8013626.1 tRNA uracil 4-sulfurtransferase ThiI [Archaeoglobaceae archaeon]
MDCFVIHYGEIGIKGKNRAFFEKKLVENIEKIAKIKAVRKSGRIEAEFKSEAEEKLKKIPGIKYFAPALKVEKDIEEIKKASLKVLPENFESFKVESSRSDKTFPLTSPEINAELGKFIVERTGKKVDLKKAEVKVYVEICEKESYIYSKKVKGVGGLPVGTAGKVVSLVSGGIDSPVASFLMMKRGCEVVAVHFFNETLHSKEVRKKIVMLAEKLAEFQGKMRLYMVPFESIQLEIIRDVPAKLRMIAYRRSMMRMANIVAKKEKAKAIVTGDNLSQVASQTLDNIATINSASALPVLSPLIGMDKEEIIEIAKKIETYKISTIPYEDCCSLLVSKHPETRARKEDVEKYEFYSELEKDVVELSEVVEVSI